MTRALQSERRGPVSGGKAKSAVIFVHGYGADGADLLGLADPLGPHLPDTVFFSPNAPEKCAGNPFGYQWFPIPWLDGSSEEQALAGLEASAVDLNAFVDKVLADERLTADCVALVGFSQGTMMSLHIAPRRDAALAGLVGFSGRLMVPEKLDSEAVSPLPILLIHGDQDDVVPLASLSEAADALVAAGFETYSHISKGTAHGIAHDGLSLALSFLREKLPG
ncbi:alpha/beta hydrolase [Roseinatronobacter bogoriensis]|uniref:Phospholipase n=1 Tax=Roseinatronobacter bogoriensis subsp. barguzinensis TaxID=441209 RepID=A0A2K8KAP1_9RHOB|nr:MULTISPECIES: dienelactone hydrolase family protein [Rhodobaca]ATX66519.1 phospholipase [Rhodobaca barguzinensis]MBB4207683.1 phospholipase/carboxylesterase [Rhodobaca bogoriensis DSM 18756]TDW40010.1 phospholipase/carboxylesterase [Rhodobaca barguzinensis]TDY70837.1 phospholipase/carboxylesterase [Rhodobaca bogoriensis DSM 18756]